MKSVILACCLALGFVVTGCAIQPPVLNSPAPPKVPQESGKPVIYAADSELGLAAARVQLKFPTMGSANQSSNPQFVDTHPHLPDMASTELAGLGATLAAIVGDKSDVSRIKTAEPSGKLDEPNALFFQRDPSRDAQDWPIIGMAYIYSLTPDSPPQLKIDGQTQRFIVHEAGYHLLIGGGFACAKDSDLTQSARDRGVTIDALGRNSVTEDDLQTKIATVKHGRILTLHVWFEPETGRPAVAMTDPWQRQTPDALKTPSCGFYFQK